MLRKLIAVAFSVMLAAASGLALAKQGGGDAGGKSGSHISTEGVENTNGTNATDRDKGQGRAADRQSEQAQGHAKHGKRKDSKKH